MSPVRPDPAAAQAVHDMAADVAVRLADLRRVLETTRQLRAGATVDLGPADEWTIAAEGLFGPDGVLGQISRAMTVDWPAFPGLGWTDGDAAQPHAGASPVPD